MPVISSPQAEDYAFLDATVSHMSMISEGRDWSRADQLLSGTSGRDMLNFHVRLHARSVIQAVWFCAPLVYQMRNYRVKLSPEKSGGF